MIPTYNVDNLTGGLDNAFQNIMQVGLGIAVVIFTIWIIVSLIIWSFRSQKKI